MILSAPISRRTVLGLMSTTAIAAALTASPLGLIPQAQAQTASPELLAKQPLPDFVLGKADAPVTIIEYASMTCSHCAAFAKTTFPKLKSAYIDTGKVRYVLREFPLDNLAAAVFLLARKTAGTDAARYYALVDLFFHTQEEWAVRNPVEPLKKVAKQAGITDEQFETAINDPALLKSMEDVREQAVKLGVNATPTFFINGTKASGAIAFEEMEKLLAPLMKS